jgi:glycosyltransferase involved in cell wall biosynthesis
MLNRRIVVLSESWRLFFTGIVDPKRIAVVFNGINTRLYYPPRERDRGDDKVVHFIFVGHVGPRKGIYELKRAVEELVAEGVKAFHVNVMGGEEFPGDRQRAMEAFVNLRDQYVTFLGPVTGDEKVHLFLKADAFLLPSHAEGLPIAILEAMAAGLPIIASRVGGIPEVVCDKENGYVIEPGDVHSLKVAMRALIQNKELGREMGVKNRVLAVANYDIERVSKDIAKTYMEVIS